MEGLDWSLSRVIYPHRGIGICPNIRILLAENTWRVTSESSSGFAGCNLDETKSPPPGTRIHERQKMSRYVSRLRLPFNLPNSADWLRTAQARQDQNPSKGHENVQACKRQYPAGF